MWKSILITVLLTSLAPSVFVKIFDSTTEPIVMQQAIEIQPQQDLPKVEIQPQTIMVLQNGDPVNMILEEYLIGVVLAEMPVDFEIEALKAQAVAARTFAYKRLLNPKHSSGDLCTDSACCQAYMSPETYKYEGGQDASLEKVRCAVSNTEGMVIVYQGDLIEATYFSCSGGRTEDAAEVWGADVPYLQAVDSPGEETAENYTQTVRFEAKEFCRKLSIPYADRDKVTISNIQYTAGGGVQSIKIGGVAFSGTELRKLLGLRSTAFAITIAGDTVTVTTKGFGHRVGMSQYGADAMAVQGKTFDEILRYYYQGTEIVHI